MTILFFGILNQSVPLFIILNNPQKKNFIQIIDYFSIIKKIALTKFELVTNKKFKYC